MANSIPTIPEDHWSRPVALAPDGQWLSLRKVVEEEPARFSFIQLTSEQQSELVAERIRQRPKFDIGILGLGVLSKKRAINEVQARMRIGRTLIEVEQRMIARLIERAREGNL
ncbi:MAG: hypothetical protein OXN25_23025 [Candidatus Poribacteria bacterium]|nr:hypothetical protein [Candidatus Poribacteria bacterium]MYK17203.1 hypothetical protein [Candidatus Poribacteria bacterium]